MVQPQFFQRRQPLQNPRSARGATERRIVYKARSRYAGIVRVGLVLGGILVLLMGYVVLTSRLTGLGYAVSDASQKREALREETMRLDDRIAALRSDDRLSQVAARLDMHEPQRFAYVQLAAPDVALRRSRFQLLSSLAGLFMPAVTRRR